MAARDYSLFGDEHVRQYEESDGQVGFEWNGTNILVLTTKRAKAGTPRKVALIFGRAGDDYVVVASKGGAPEHPLWYRDLVAHPDVRLQVRDQRFAARARTATPDEKPALWKTMTGIWPDYDEYQRHTDREIPVVVLTPAAGR